MNLTLKDVEAVGRGEVLFLADEDASARVLIARALLASQKALRAARDLMPDTLGGVAEREAEVARMLDEAIMPIGED